MLYMAGKLVKKVRPHVRSDLFAYSVIVLFDVDDVVLLMKTVKAVQERIQPFDMMTIINNHGNERKEVQPLAVFLFLEKRQEPVC